MDHQEIAAIGRRAALMALAGSALLANGGCYAVQAMIARLAGDDSFDEDGGTADHNDDPHLSRGDRRREPSSGSAATQGDGIPPDEPADEHGY